MIHSRLRTKSKLDLHSSRFQNSKVLFTRIDNSIECDTKMQPSEIERFFPFLVFLLFWWRNSRFRNWLLNKRFLSVGREKNYLFQISFSRTSIRNQRMMTFKSMKQNKMMHSRLNKMIFLSWAITNHWWQLSDLNLTSIDFFSNSKKENNEEEKKGKKLSGVFENVCNCAALNSGYSCQNKYLCVDSMASTLFVCLPFLIY